MPFDRCDSDGGSGPFLLDLCNVENECSFAADLLVLLPLFGTIWKWKFLDHQTNIYDGIKCKLGFYKTIPIWKKNIFWCDFKVWKIRYIEIKNPIFHLTLADCYNLL